MQKINCDKYEDCKALGKALFNLKEGEEILVKCDDGGDDFIVTMIEDQTFDFDDNEMYQVFDREPAEADSIEFPLMASDVGCPYEIVGVQMWEMGQEGNWSFWIEDKKVTFHICLIPF